MLLLCCCIVGNRRKSARLQSPTVKPPLASVAPPRYSMYPLPNSNKPGQDQNQQSLFVQQSVYGNNPYPSGQGSANVEGQNIGGYQPPPPYGKAAGVTDNYSPVRLILSQP